MNRLRNGVGAACGAMALALGCGCAMRETEGPRWLRESLARRDLNRAERRLEQGDFQGAEAALRQAVARVPDNGEAQGQLGLYLANHGRHEEALERLREAVKRGPDRFEFALGLGEELRRVAVFSMQRQTMLPAAVRAYEHALSLNGASVDAMVGMGICHRELGDLGQAMQRFRDAARIAPDSVRTHLEIAMTYEAGGDDRRALGAYRRALRLSPDDAATHIRCARASMRLARARGRSGRISRERAAAHLRRALAIEPTRRDARMQLERLERQERSLAEAEVDE